MKVAHDLPPPLRLLTRRDHVGGTVQNGEQDRGRGKRIDLAEGALVHPAPQHLADGGDALTLPSVLGVGAEWST
ncbi:MAG: hypothetical protein HOV96_31010 [Nonomuraea sp.]|nr:hypothetical protein [Nonomuraea sp.]NUP60755.1 hypothetical protein [Nonomuraea sp.]NUP81978.1 hypothetical protein [Nonomuraea sp.]NUS04304.1 hypothetical protein [Nonomuraea sp.]